jgi:threonine synthase
MRLVSTRGKAEEVSFCTAVERGIAEDGGLYVPLQIPPLSPDFFASAHDRPLPSLAFDIARHVLEGEIPEKDLGSIIDRSLTFPAPLHYLADDLAILELFHGPTLAFKDFGAQFMARTLAWLGRNADTTRFILVATSGDTGSAVAHAFQGVEGMHVILLYPSGRISAVQELQLTTLRGNVTALEINGTFDDCQRLVKEAFADTLLRERMHLTSANSINIARLLPQAFYYVGAWAQRRDRNRGVDFSVPSGNLGNLTAGMIAMRLGLPVRKFTAAVNANAALPRFLQTGRAESAPAIQTISNAMDVGDPSNLARLRSLFGDRTEDIHAILSSWSFSDDETRAAIRRAHKQHSYILDPHGAVGYCGLERLRETDRTSTTGIVLETAHPAKFLDALDESLRPLVEVPARLKAALEGEKRSVFLAPVFTEFRDFLLHTTFV